MVHPGYTVGLNHGFIDLGEDRGERNGEHCPTARVTINAAWEPSSQLIR